jgi:hypothetical protein
MDHGGAPALEEEISRTSILACLAIPELMDVNAFLLSSLDDRRLAHRAENWTRLFADADLRFAANDALTEEDEHRNRSKKYVHLLVRCSGRDSSS